MNRRYDSIGEHPCKISSPSDDPNDCWPSLTPRATILQRTTRALRRYTLPSYGHPQTRYVFRSISSFRAEKIRMIYHCCPIILHPFSVLAIFRLICYFFLMLIYFIINTYMLYFRMYDEVSVVIVFTKLIHIVFIATQFMVGYVDRSDQQINVILSAKKIAIWNLKRYLCFDLLELFRIFLIFVANEACEIWLHFVVFHLFTMALIHRFFMSRNDSVRVLLHNLLGNTHTTLGFISFLVFIAFCVHYLACFKLGMPHLIKIMGGSEIEKSSGIQIRTYLYAVHKVLMSMYRAVAIFERTEVEYYEIVECICLICVYILHFYVVVYVLVAARNTNKSKFKYNVMWNNVQNFLKNRNISGKLRYKILAHYQHKFQYKFFEEAFIIESLSQHLQYECQLHTCSHLIMNTSLLRGLPKVAVGRIVAVLKPIVYLPNDVILTWQENFDGIYFISYGTVAIYIDQGKEVMHLEDGGIIGATGYYLGTNFFTTTSVTITEIYKLEIEDLERVTKYCPDLSVRLKAIGSNRIKQARSMYEDELNLVRLARKLQRDGRNLRSDEAEEDDFYTKNI